MVNVVMGIVERYPLCFLGLVSLLLVAAGVFARMDARR
jgi:hypothetical protein